MKKTGVFVTHDMNSMKEFCDRAMLIEDSKMKLIGNPQMVARSYSLLFMNEQDSSISTVSADGKRWGNGAAQLKDVHLEFINDSIKVKSVVKMNKSIDRMLYGIHIFSQDGTEITATNNRMINVDDLESLSVGEEVIINWEMLNIFNDGKYFVTLTLADDENNTLDWYNEATTFIVKRPERSTTAVIPPLSVKSKVIKVNKARG